MTLQELLSDRLTNHHTSHGTHLAELARLDRLRVLLVRYAEVAASPAPHKMPCTSSNICVKADKRDYVRDVSLPISDSAYQGDFPAADKSPTARAD